MNTGMDAGTYEVLRDRLRTQAAELARRAEALDTARTAAFGSTRLTLNGTDHLRTATPGLARDIVPVGDRLLLGCDPPAALTPGTPVGEVFALYDRELNRLPQDAEPGLLDDPAFIDEFAALCRYFQGARLVQLRPVDGKLLAVFRTGEKDIRVLRWSLAPAAPPRFLDARGERDHVFPPPYDFEWTPTTRDDQVLGRHPHVRVDGGTVYVSTVGGALTVKTENDTESPDGVHSEPVDEPLQSLADAEIAYARVGPLLLLRVRPYNEDVRHLVVNTLTATVVRLDGIGRSCRRLPDDEGIVFPGGYCLASGAVKLFSAQAAGTEELEFERAVRSPGGDDVLFAFRARTGGRSLLLPYNTIRKEIDNPLLCRGHALFDDGTLVVLHTTADTAAGADSPEPAHSHQVRLWTSPYVSDTHPVPAVEGPLARIGNADLVRGLSDCLAVARQAMETTPSARMYETLLAACVRTADRYHWLGDPEAGDLRAPLAELRTTAAQTLDEFATVRTLTRQAADALADTAAQIARLVRRIRGEAPATAEEWVSRITELRACQGRLLTLKEMRYADADAIDALASDVENDTASAARRAVAFLQRDDAFTEYEEELARLTAEAAEIDTAAEADRVTGRLDERAAGLGTLTEIVAGLEIGDATVRTGVLERIAHVIGSVNRARATLAARREELAEREDRAEFAAELTLLGQSVTGALASVDSPESCAAQLARLLLQLENLESRFADHDGFLGRIEEKRTEVYEAFSAREQSLRDARARRAERLADSAARVLEAIARRAATLESADAVGAFFASDPMAARIRRTADELRALGDEVRAEELTGRLKAARQEAGRALRDRTELFEDGGRTIRLGRHRFAVTTQAPELTLVPSGDGMAFALTGTDYRSPAGFPTDSQDGDPDRDRSSSREGDPDRAAPPAAPAAPTAASPYWTRTLPSESPEVYRAEYLAARLLPEASAGADPAALVARAVSQSYDEGYERGVHDHDAEAILALLLRLSSHAGLLRFPGAARANAQLFWAHGTTPADRGRWTRQAVSLVRARELFGSSPALAVLRAELADATGSSMAAAYLIEELAGGGSFTTSAAARTLLDKFHRAVGSPPYDLTADDPASARRLVEGWLASYADASGEQVDPGDLAEAAALELCPELPRHDVDAPLTGTVTGLLGSHPRLSRGSLTLRLDEFLSRTGDFADRLAPGFRAYQKARGALVAAERSRLRLDDHRPRVMSSFVRNRLVDEVYLPLVGDNLAKQLGVAGEAKRTDNSGLLLLLSPPGYGKTTLVEYVAERLGLLLVKVDGPALGRDTVSLDPAEAPNTAARRELEKIDFALSAGNNVMLYVDDIQHTSPELLQKFIPLCDATRTLNGRELRGKRFAVCMAGNPYTESGARFRLPDMLANRADVWNLGDVLTGKEDAFAASFVENALTSHPVLAPLAAHGRADLDLLVRLASGDPTARRDRLTHAYAAGELDAVLAVLRHLLTARTTVLAVNASYIASAARADASRTEPPFRLQGSYRNLNRIVQRISPAMNDAELSAVVDDHYRSEAQTLTADAESNLLKLAELRGTLGEGARAATWSAVKAAYLRDRAAGEAGALDRAVTALGLLADRLSAVESAITRSGSAGRPPAADPEE
ncbi:DNA repair ATPase [Streptomyces sp. NPDC004838]